MRSALIALITLFLIGCTTPQPTHTAAPPTRAQPTLTVAAPVAASPSQPPTTSSNKFQIQEYAVPRGSRPHDVAPDLNTNVVWYTAQATGELGKLNPATGETKHIKLGNGSSPHGVIMGSDGAAWVTDSGLNAIVRVDPKTEEVKVFALSGVPNINMNTAAFDSKGILWFTGQNGYYGRLDVKSGKIEAFSAPRGRGPYGIAATPEGVIYYASLAGSHIARIEGDSAKVIEPPTAGQGARRVWSDSKGRVWVSEWNSGQVSMFEPKTNAWRAWKAPGERAAIYAVYVDDRDYVWLSDFNANALVRFDPSAEKFETFNLPSANASVRQILGRRGEVWGAESGADKLVVIRTP
jgi:virginiamycin B lyase